MKVTKKLLSQVIANELEFTTDNFKVNIDAIFTVSKSVQDSIQLGIDFAIKHAKENDNSFNLINYVITAATSSYGNGIRSNTLKDYIKEVIKGTKIVMDKDGNWSVKKESKKTKLVYDLELLESLNWYDFNTDGKAKPDMDLMKSIELLIKKAEKALEKGTMKDSESASELLERLGELTA